MFISRSMTQKVVSIQKDTNLLEAKELMEKNNFRHLPVVEADNRLIGIVTDRDIRSAMPSIAYYDPGSEAAKDKVATIKIEDIMTRNPQTDTATGLRNRLQCGQVHCPAARTRGASDGAQ